MDNGYTSFQTRAHAYRRGTHLLHRPHDDWAVCEPVARPEVEKRVHMHWKDDGFPVEGSWDARVGFLFDHGLDPDRDAIGRWVRDRMLTTQTPEEAALLRERRSQNEGLHGHFKLLPLTPPRRGGRAQYWRVLALRRDRALGPVDAIAERSEGPPVPHHPPRLIPSGADARAAPAPREHPSEAWEAHQESGRQSATAESPSVSKSSTNVRFPRTMHVGWL